MVIILIYLLQKKALHSFVEEFNKVTFALLRLVEDALNYFSAVIWFSVCYIIVFFIVC